MGFTCSGGGSAGEVVTKTELSVSGHVKICVGAGGGWNDRDWYMADIANEGMEGSASTFTSSDHTITTVGGGGGGQGIRSPPKYWRTGGTGGAYGTGGGITSHCGTNGLVVDGAIGSRPIGSPHKGGDGISNCNAYDGECGGGGGAGGSGAPKIGGVGVHVAAFDVHVGGGGAGTRRHVTGSSSDGGERYYGPISYTTPTIPDEYPHGVDGTGGGGGGSKEISGFSLGGYGGSGVVMIRHRIGQGPLVVTEGVDECDRVCSAGCSERVPV